MFQLPPSIKSILPTEALSGDAEKAGVAIRLAEAGGKEGLGGPFGAIIVNMRSRKIVAAGVNMVLAQRQSIAHAEIVAISNAQRILNDHHLRNEEDDAFELITSCEPCAMCYGAIGWAGVTRLVCCARTEDAQVAGFNEGYKPQDWADYLRQRGIEVVLDVRRNEAAHVLRDYRRNGGRIY